MAYFYVISVASSREFSRHVDYQYRSLIMKVADLFTCLIQKSVGNSFRCWNAFNLSDTIGPVRIGNHNGPCHDSSDQANITT